MSIAGITAPIAVTPARPGVDNMIKEKGINPGSGRLLENFCMARIDKAECVVLM